MNSMKRSFCGLASLAVAFVSLLPVSATTYTWTDGAGNFNWNTSSANWSTGGGNVVWADGNDAVLGTNGVGTITVSGTPTVNNLTVNAAGFSLKGGQINPGPLASFTINSNLTIGSTIVGVNTLYIFGVGTLTLTGTNTSTGGYYISQGNLVLNAGVLGVGIVHGTVYINGGTLTVLGNTNQTSFPLAGSDVIQENYGTVVVAGAGGTNGYKQASYAGTNNLVGAIGYGANFTTPDGSALLFQGGYGGVVNSTGVASNSFAVNILLKNAGGGPGIFSSAPTNILGISGAIADYPGYAGNPLLFGGGGTVVLLGTNSYVGPNSVSNVTAWVSNLGNGGSAGNLGAAGNSATNLIFYNGTLLYTGTDASTDRGFTIQAGTTATLNIAASTLTFSNSSPATSGALVKTGAGTLVLAGTNSYSGATTVSNGTLLVNGSLPASAVVVKSGAMIGGSGRLGSSLTLATNATLELALTAGLTNGLTVAGVTTLNGNILVSPLTAGAALPAGTYTLLTATGGLTGTYTLGWYDPSGLTQAAAFTTNGNKLQVTVTTKPVVITQSATGVTGTNATLNGSVNPNYLAAGSYFEIGLDTNYGTVAGLSSGGGFSTLAATNALLAVPGATVSALTQPAGMTWSSYNSFPSPTNNHFSANYFWTYLVASADGTRLAALDSYAGTGLWTSTNGGFTWTQRTNNLPTSGYSALAGSADGTHLAVGASGIWISTNSGVTWQKSDGPAGPPGIAMSADGMRLATAYGVNNFYSSTDGGFHWNLSTNIPNVNFGAIASSADGSRLVAVGSGQVCTSTNGGISWTLQTNSPFGYWRVVASSSDGTRLVAGVINTNGYSNGGIYTSTNAGVNWVLQTNTPTSADWYSLCSSADGTRLAGTAFNSNPYTNGGIYTSTNAGVNWVFQTNATYNSTWYTVASSADGSRLAVGNVNLVWNSSGTSVPLLPATTYHYRLVGFNDVGLSQGADQTFTTGVAAPTVSTTAATGIAAISAGLNGTVNPGGGVTAAYFRYGLTTSYGNFTTTNTLAAVITNLAVAISANSLLPGTLYHYQLVASNSAGLIYGGDLTFTTIPAVPVVTTLAASGLTPTNGTLNGTVNPGGGVTTAYFQYGLTTNYGSFSATNTLTATNASLAVSNLISSLSPGATYHYQLVAANSSGTVYGADGTLATLAGPLTVYTLAASGITAITATLNASVYAGTNPATAYFQYGLTTNYGSVTTTTGVPTNSPALAVANLVSGLNPNTTYHFQAVASNRLGIVRGVDLTWSTPPGYLTVTTLPATGVTSNSATLNGSVIPFSSPASTYFAYGADTNYGNLGGFATLPAANALINVPGLAITSLAGAAGSNWVQTGPSFPPWSSIASSGDGTRLAAWSYNNGVYTSTDGGVTWTQQTNSPTLRAQAIASSADGTRLAAAMFNNGIYTSTNSGVTWTQQTNAPTASWQSIASSADGTRLLAGAGGNSGLYLSTNSGSSWTQAAPAAISFYHWYGVAVSADGIRLAATAGNYGVWTSPDGGLTWTQQTNAPSQYLSSVVSSADGNRLAIASSQTNFPIYTTTNGGATWSATTSPGLSWTSLASSADGTRLTATVAGNGVWTSTNGGGTWIQGNAPSNTWTSLAASADGTRLALASSGNGIWTSAGPTNLFTPGTTYHYQLVGSEPGTTVLGGDLTFTTPAGPPLAITLAATGVTSNNATLNASVSSRGTATAVWFKYGSTTNYGSVTATTNLAASATSYPVTNLLVSLTPGGTYHFQAVASNSVGLSLGADASFTTVAPVSTVATTLAASGVTATNATLNGTVNPGNLATMAWFQYGATTSYGSVTAAINLPATNSPLAVSNVLSSLTPGATYHFQLVASNSAGKVNGGDLSFILNPLAPVATTLAASSVTAASAALNGKVNPGGGVTAAWFQFGLTTNYGFTGGTVSLPATNSALDVTGFTVSSILVPAGGSWNRTAGPADYWVAMASSADGTRLAVVDQSGNGIWTSTNTGLTWTRQTNAPAIYWSAIASSTDGTRLAATDGNLKGIWTSTNSGITWTKQNNAPTNYWNCIASSADGTRLVVGAYSGQIYTSTNGGVTWTIQNNSPSTTWIGMAASADGLRLAGAGYLAGIWTSTDGGVTWTKQANAPAVAWANIASSADGTRLTAVDQSASGGVWTSIDSGVTWTQASVPATSWYGIASSSDGTILAAASYSAGIWLSANSGTTWTQSSAQVTNGWYCIASSADGTKLASGSYGNGIWTSAGASFTVTPGTTYHYQLVATNGGGTGLGGDLTFTTPAASTNQPVNFKFTLTNSVAAGGLRLNFTNLTGLGFTLLGSTNVALPVANWTVLGPVVESPAGSGRYQYTNLPTTTLRSQFYRVRSP